MKYLAIFCSLLLFSCSSNEDEVQNPDNPNNGGNNTTNGRFKISFSAIGSNGEKHFKATYKFDDGTPQVVDYDGNVTPEGFATGDANERIDLEIEMKSGICYLKNINFKVEDLQTGEIKYQSVALNQSNSYILSPDLLTEKNYLNNLYGYPSQHFNPQNNYKIKYHATINYSSQGWSLSDLYDYRDDILVHKPTRGSLRIVINNYNLNDYQLSIPNAWAIRDYVIGSSLNNVLSDTNTFNNNVNKTYELILPGHLSSTSINLKGINVTATIYLMRKDGTTEAVTVTSTNNQLMTTSFNL